jgi:hypothetical protein
VNLDSFSDWILGGSSNPLPVELINFQARLLTTQSTKVEWVTASEMNNDFFEVQRSVDGINWTVVRIVDGANTTFETKSYSIVDPFGASVTANVIYYRLRQVDNDGAFEYSEVRKVTLNPTTDVVNVWYDRSANKMMTTITVPAQRNVTVKMFDINGKLVGETAFSMEKGTQLVNFDGNGLAKGIYSIIANTGTETTIKRVAKF